jgi:hypothetical protein
MGKLVILRAARKRAHQLKHTHAHVGWNTRHRFYVNVRPFKHGQIVLGKVAKRKLAETDSDLVLTYSPTDGFRVKLVAPPKPSKRQVAVKYCEAALAFAGRMVYDESPLRSELFNRQPGDFAGAHADCSQFVSAVMHWSGVTDVNQWDDTGTLLEKGRAVTEPAIARLIIAGSGTGVHVGMFTENVDGVWQIVEDGDQAAPDRISEPAFKAYFQSRGVTEFRNRDFFE